MEDLTIVTGGAGFIGSHLVERLDAEGERVRVVERPGADVSHLPGSVEVVFADIRDPEAVRRAVAGGRRVYHLAANPNLWVLDRSEFDAVNHRGAVLVIDAALEAGAERVLHCSTESILTRARAAGPIAEDVEVTDRDAVGPYCLSKLRAERAALERARAGAPVVVANPTMPVGPGDRGCSPPTRLIWDFCAGRLPAVMDCTLNLIDVRDAAEGLLRTMRLGQPGRRYLLGGENLSLLGILEILGEICDRRPPRLRVPYGVALAAAYLSEFWSDHISGRAPQATVTGVRLTRRSMHFDASRSLRELGLAPRPVRGSLAEAVRWLEQRGGPSAGASRNPARELPGNSPAPA
ncbi:NAD-dependent epimerase/dehydratase family protein [Tautonia sociabilis]|uniref:NAD-dependent epimerase/dehydratase family protein n=1 Tax=Tautonia sociabilis TaxID=2080755 RepID=A0A432MIZ0_9BACT|nr:NAD-dependent epimerase/dehydratase family protein [Tautonia sociabilis]RUL87332.1 NAD-dependent epimerase/dehydratase family protein [Tautonia sociabilis]